MKKIIALLLSTVMIISLAFSAGAIFGKNEAVEKDGETYQRFTFIQ